MQIIEQAVGYKRGHLGYGVLMAMHEGLCRGRFCRVREEVQQLEITVVSIVETSLCMVGRGSVIVVRKTEMQRQGRKKE